MTKKKVQHTPNELRVDWVTETMPFELMKQGYRLRGLKLRFNGADWFAVLEVVQDGEYYVGFAGGATIPRVCEKLWRGLEKDEIKWKVDQYAKRD